MKRSLVAASLAAAALAAVPAGAVQEITPAMQKEISRRTEVIRKWAASPVIVKAVLAQNEKGPIPGMDNVKWKSVRRSDELIRSFVGSEAGRFLAARLEESKGLYARAFLCASRGEKGAFNEKTISYLHKGSAKFDVPMATGKAWQGPPELDEITETIHVQVAVPVLAEGKPAGVLVVGIDISKLQKSVGG